MLKTWIEQVSGDIDIPEDELEKRLEKARADLNAKQTAIKEHGIPVLVTFDGWGAAGKGSILGKVIKNLDPRFFKVHCMDVPTDDEKRRPFLYRHFIRIPEAGKFSFFDGSWMDEAVKGLLAGDLDKETYSQRMQSIKRFERTLHDNGYLIVKFFFNISKKEQKKRLGELDDRKSTRWRVGYDDLWQNKHYKEFLDVFNDYINATDQFAAPWYFVDSSDKKTAELKVLETLNESIDAALSNTEHVFPVIQNTFKLLPIPDLKDIPLDKTYDPGAYKTDLDKLQKKLGRLHNKIYKYKIPVIIGYEGWDAAGKGGNIKRISAALDPRGYEVQPIASPEPHEKARHFLWRFWNRLPKDGHITIFDRTWYGRVMVERLEGFCSENDWKRAYNEINEFEKELVDWGAVVIKFWVQIDKDTQLERFNDRQNTPEKRWKITDEDWRNREKWDQYEGAIDEMLKKTNTDFAPWHILESDDKKYARIKALNIVIDELEKKIKEVEGK
ncbi:MAG: polyphosphate:AMP phosphotransferase [Lachnospiraceae bacterium]|jgi:polyphosphate:AMP phosphotransferase|nr:polyphosphate:AMP phosphotransferase [Lachnospiraceae bacterium]MEE3461594.1 polyphosphate:AMP phosphotransferase [Lachnospiraceae bacterium]